MFEVTVPAVAMVFVGLASIFTGAALRDFRLAADKHTTARNTGSRIGLMFSGVAIGPFVRHLYLV